MKTKKSEVESHIFKNEFLEIKSKYNIIFQFILMVRNKMRKLLVLLLVQFLLITLDYLIIAPSSPLLPDNISIFTAEAKTIDIALYHIRNQSEKKKKKNHQLFRFSFCIKIS